METETLDVTRFHSPQMNSGAPEGWTLLKHRGKPVMEMQREGDHFYLHMASRGDSAFGIRKGLSVDLKTHPFLNWTWRVRKLPAGGDVRRAESDDQSLQIYLGFQTTSWLPVAPPSLQTPTLAYIWDNEAPKGTMIASPHRLMDAVRYIVIKNGMDPTGRWHTEKRNVLEDSRNAFRNGRNEDPGTSIKGILLFINSHHTKSEAEGDIGEIHFSSH